MEVSIQIVQVVMDKLILILTKLLDSAYLIVLKSSLHKIIFAIR
jgi:hypothetical protein